MPETKPSPAWKLAINNLCDKVGQTFKNGAYELTGADERGFTFTRCKTGKTVRISRALIERTYDRLAAGDSVDFREISYTTAVEYGVLLALDGFVYADEEKRRYVKATPKRRKPNDHEDGRFSGLTVCILPTLLHLAWVAA